eukprot:GHVL01005929.1.p1 GENE.GHVL01005929.1~~GHVL01005929.1.p1  ORF type:complete len:408 (-),score=67.62 GHVL01005929.1:1090-2313(-)
MYISPYEAELYIKNIKKYNIYEIGNNQWMKQADVYRRLNAQAHASAISKSDEYVVDLIKLYQLETTIHELIVTEVWALKIYPRLKEDARASVKLYIALYHEAVLTNLLALVFYEFTVPDCIIDLIDYCYRKITYLIQTKDLLPPPLTAKDIEKDDSDDKYRQLQFQIGLASVSVFRLLTQNFSELPISAINRIYDTNDFLLTLIPLLEKAPWVKSDSSGATLVFQDNKWEHWPDRNKVPKLEADIWISIYNLIMNNDLQLKYDLSSFRKENLLKIRRYMTEVLQDQLPFLADLKHFLNQLAISNYNPGGTPPFIVEMIPELYDSLMQKNDWASIAKTQAETTFAKDDPQDLKDFIANIEDIDDEPCCAVCGKPAGQRCSRCREEWYCTRDCQISHWRQHKSLCYIKS